MSGQSEVTTYDFTVTGDVQGVGYRRAVQRVARKLKIDGYVKNLKDGTVQIVAQSGSASNLEDFEKAISIDEPPIRVERVEKKSIKLRRRHKFFAIYPNSMIDELQEGFGSMESQFNDYRGEFRNFANRTDGNFKGLKSEFSDYRGEFGAYRSDFGDFGGRTDGNFKSLDTKYSEISEKLTHILETLEKESTETRKELTRAVDNLVAVVQKTLSKSD